ncbi:MAG: hypothetical protein QM811_19555 [Pirellulales bacterium]
MFGDSLGLPTQVNSGNIEFGSTNSTIPLNGGGTTKVAENGCSLPADRIFLNYNHFVNAYAAQSTLFGTTTPPQTFNFDQVTLGFEKTFHDGDCSIEVRMPFHENFDFDDGQYNTVSSGNIGNLTVYLKTLLLATEDFALGAGLGIGARRGTISFPPRISNATASKTTPSTFCRISVCFMRRTSGGLCRVSCSWTSTPAGTTSIRIKRSEPDRCRGRLS